MTVLTDPFVSKKFSLKNRLVMSPMSIGHTVNGFITDDVVELYKRRAAGGVGLIVAFALCALFRIPEMRLVLGLIEKVTGRFARK